MLRECPAITFHESSGSGYYLDFHEPDGTRFYLTRDEVKQLVQNIIRVAGNDIIFNADDGVKICTYCLQINGAHHPDCSCPEFKGGELHEPMG